MKPEARNLYDQNTKEQLAEKVVLYRTALKSSIGILRKLAALANNSEVLSLLAELETEMKKIE